MSLITFEDFKKSSEYQKFSQENPAIGYLKVQVFTAYGAIPVPDTSILITKDIGENKVVFFQGKTDSSGIIDNIQLPAPNAVPETDIDTAPEYTLYDLTAIHEGYESLKKYSVGMFGGIRVIQYVKMTPLVDMKGVEQNGN